MQQNKPLRNSAAVRQSRAHRSAPAVRQNVQGASPVARRNGTLRDAPPGRKNLTVRPEAKRSPVKEPEKKPQHVSVQSSPPIPGKAHPAASPWTMMSPTESALTETASQKEIGAGHVAETLLSAKNRPKKRTPEKAKAAARKRLHPL